MTDRQQESSGPGKDSGARQKHFRWLRMGLLNVVFLVAPFGAWYFMHVQSGLETNTVRIFRALSEIDGTLVDNFDNLSKIWRFSDQVTSSKFEAARREELDRGLQAIREKQAALDAGIEDYVERQRDYDLTRSKLEEREKDIRGMQAFIDRALEQFRASGRLAYELQEAHNDLRGELLNIPVQYQTDDCREALRYLSSWSAGANSVSEQYLEYSQTISEVDQLGDSLLDPAGLLTTLDQNIEKLRNMIPPGVEACLADHQQTSRQKRFKSAAPSGREATEAVRSLIYGIRQISANLARMQNVLGDLVEAVYLNREKVEQLAQSEALRDDLLSRIDVHGTEEINARQIFLERRAAAIIAEMTRLDGDTNLDRDRLSYTDVIKLNPALKNIYFNDILAECEDSAMSLGVKSKDNHYMASVICRRADAVDEGPSEGDNPADEDAPGPAGEDLVKVPVDDLLDSVVAEVSARFDHVLLASRDGRIISRVKTRILKDSKLTGAVSTDPFRYDYFHYSNLKPILANSGGCDEDEPVLESEGNSNGDAVPHSHADTCQITVGKTQFTLFIQPSSLEVQLDGKETDWYLIGVVRKSGLISEALIAPLSVTGPVLVLIIMALAALPLLWLSTKSRRTLLSTSHFTLVLGGGLIILALAATLAVHLLYVRDLGLQRDVSVKELHQRINDRFLVELDSRIENLNRVWSEQGCDLGTEWSQPGLPPYELRMVLGRNLTTDDPGPSRGITVTVPEHYRHYTPQWAWLESRQYYQQPVLGNTWTRTIDNRPHEFYIERIRSFVDGIKEAVLAIPVQEEKRVHRCKEDTRAEVLVEIQPFHSLTHAAMQPHHGFAIVEDGSGQVLFHSTDNRSLEENFIDETDGDQHLISLLQSRTHGFLTLEYHGETIRAFAAPVESVPWTLITFMDDEIMDTVLLETLVSSAGFVICYTILLMLAFWAFAWTFDRRSAHGSLHWLWPNPDYSHRYWFLFRGVVILSLLFIVMSVWNLTSDSTIHQLFFLAPLITLLTVRFVFNPDMKNSAHWLGGLVLLLIVVSFAWANRGQEGAWLWGSVILVSIGLLSFRGVHLKSGPNGPTSSLNHMVSILPVVAMLLYTGPVVGVILYKSVFEAYAMSSSHYFDEQVLRALDLEELDHKREFRRYFDNSRGEPPVPPMPFRIQTDAAQAECPGPYLASGPFLENSKLQGRNGEKARFSRLCIAGPFRQQEATPKCDPTPRPLPVKENWVSWFVPSLPAFSHESGAIKLSARNQRDTGRLVWCELPGNAGGPGRSIFVGRSALYPEYGWVMDASDLSFRNLSKQDVDPRMKVFELGSIRVSVLSSALLLALLMASILYAVARIISHHLFGSNIPLVDIERMTVAKAKKSDDKALVLISSRCIREEWEGDGSGKVFIINPQDWGRYRGPMRYSDLKQGAAGDGKKLDFSDDEILVVDDTETMFGIEEQRKVLFETLNNALSGGARIIMLTRVDPVYWLDKLDSRSLSEIDNFPIGQSEVMEWNSLLRAFKVALVKLAGTEKELSQARRDHEHAQNWAVSTWQEKNVLVNLALADLFNPKNSDEIRHLIRRGMVLDKPPCRLLDTEFKTYILSSSELDLLNDWRKEGGDSLWSALWPTLLVIIGLLMFFVVSSGQNTVRTAFTLLASVIASLPVLMSVFAFARSNSGN